MFKMSLLTLEDFQKNLLKYTKNPIYQNDLQLIFKMKYTLTYIEMLVLYSKVAPIV